MLKIIDRAKSWLNAPYSQFLIASFPILSLFQSNIEELELGDIFRPLVATLLATYLLFLAINALVKDRDKAAAINSLIFLLFFSYGHFYRVLKPIQLFNEPIGRHRYLLPMWLLIASTAIYIVLGRLQNTYRLKQILRVTSIILILIPAISILSYQFQLRGSQQQFPAGYNLPESVELSEDNMPDIYYIIVDGYSREDNMLERFNYDNSDFIHFLESSGFVVEDNSRANFLFTHLSLSTSLNMDYITNLLPNWQQGDTIDATPFLLNNRVRTSLEGLGYRTVSFVSGWQQSEWYDADFVFAPNMSRLDRIYQAGYFSSFESMLIDFSLLMVLNDVDTLSGTNAAAFIQTRLNAPFVIQREIILAIFENLRNVPAIPGPKFVFAHILSPHPPYIFGPTGEAIPQSSAFTLSDNLDLSIEEAKIAYTNQAFFISSMLEETIAEILRQTERPVVIILQSDHGQGRLFEAEPYEDAILDRISILNAYYLPSTCQGLLYPSITPVNSFRLVFNCIFGQNFQLLDDETYFGFEEFAPIQTVFPDIVGDQ